MCLFNPIKKQYNRLASALSLKPYMPLEEAAEIMSVSPTQVKNSLLSMEQRGLFQQEIPRIDEKLGLVYLGGKGNDHVYVLGATDCALLLLNQARMLLPEYDAYRETNRRAGKAKNLEKAFMSFAENAMNGKKIGSNFKDAARSYLYRRRVEEDRLLDMRQVLDTLTDGITRLRGYAHAHAEQFYPEKLRHFLAELCITLRSWLASLEKNGTSEAKDQVRFFSEKLAEDFAIRIPEIEELVRDAKNRSPQTDFVQNVRGEIALSLDYLRNVLNGLRDYRIHAAVVRIVALLEQIDLAYGETRNGYSASDAKSLKTIYLPMLRSLLDKYVSYERSHSQGTLSGYKPEETLGVLENELPRALTTIRDELQKTQASAMEDEATALRRKLELDGLL